MDATLDRYTHKLIAWFFHSAMWLFNRICDFYEFLYTWGVNLKRAVENMQKREKWILINPNSLPYCVKEDFDTSPYGISLYGISTRIFYPDTRQFFLANIQEGIAIAPRKRFDIVDAVVEGSGVSLNITEFMMGVSWGSEGISAPSLFEVVLLSTLFTQTPEPVSKIERWNLIVMDSDANTHTIHLSSHRAKEQFRAW